MNTMNKTRKKRSHTLKIYNLHNSLFFLVLSLAVLVIMCLFDTHNTVIAVIISTVFVLSLTYYFAGMQFMLNTQAQHINTQKTINRQGVKASIETQQAIYYLINHRCVDLQLLGDSPLLKCINTINQMLLGDQHHYQVNVQAHQVIALLDDAFTRSFNSCQLPLEERCSDLQKFRQSVLAKNKSGFITQDIAKKILSVIDRQVI